MMLRVRYEDLVADPTKVVTDVLWWAGLDLGPRDLTFIEGSSAQLETGHSVSGNPSRFDIGHVELRLDESWRTKLSPRDRRLVTAMTLPWLLRYRYPVRTTAP